MWLAPSVLDSTGRVHFHYHRRFCCPGDDSTYGGKNPRMTPSSAHLYTGKLGENKLQGPQTGKRGGWCGRLHSANIASIPVRITEISNILPQPRGLTCQSQATASLYRRCNKSRRAHRGESDLALPGRIEKDDPEKKTSEPCPNI